GAIEDYNTFLNTGLPGGPNGGSGANDVIVASDAVDPFVNDAGANYHLTGSTATGLTLLPPYNIDPDGARRGFDGSWDRGAYEFISGGATSFTAPARMRTLRIQGW